MKLALQAKPTFWAPVEIPAPGGAVTIQVEFKHRTRAEWKAFLDAVIERGSREGGKVEEVDEVLAIASGWKDVDGEFTRENIAIFLDSYHAASHAIGSTYARELTQARLGN